MGMGNIAITGMQAAMSNMDVISNNIANSSTYAFKGSSATFADIFSPNNSSVNIGLGVDLQSVDQDFSPGGFQPTGIASNLCINGNGFFILKNASSSQISYSRAGGFNFDQATGYFKIGNNRLQGYPAVNGAISSGSNPTDLQINVSPLPAKATATVSIQSCNFNSSDPIINQTTNPFSPSTPASYNATTTTTIFDSLGNATPLSLYYVKTAANTWSVYSTVNGTVINGSSPGAVSFTSSGQLSSVTGLNSLSFSPTTGAVTPQVFAVNLTGATQYGSPDSTLLTADGYPAGSFQTYNIDTNGMVTATYNNGQPPVLVGQVALANFQATQNLENIGGGMWIANSASGQPNISASNSNSNITSGGQELSNVDLATQLVTLINAQNAFQANAQVEQTYNQVMQTVTKL